MNLAAFSKELLAISKLWFCPAFCWRDTTIHSVFPAFPSSTTFLLAFNRSGYWAQWVKPMMNGSFVFHYIIFFIFLSSFPF